MSPGRRMSPSLRLALRSAFLPSLHTSSASKPILNASLVRKSPCLMTYGFMRGSSRGLGPRHVGEHDVTRVGQLELALAVLIEHVALLRAVGHHQDEALAGHRLSLVVDERELGRLELLLVGHLVVDRL